MSWDFDKIPKYVINLDKRTDRWKHFESQPGLPDFQNIRRYSAVDGNALNIDNDKRVSLFTHLNILRGERRSHWDINTKGGIGCYMSHVNIWEEFQNSQYEVALVMEDDIILSKDSANTLKTWIKESKVMQNTDLWDFCILAPTKGIETSSKDRKPLMPLYKDDPTCIRLELFNCMVAYLITKKGVRKIMPHIYPIEGHIDWFLSASSQLKIINVCAPSKPLFKYKYTVTDIHKSSSCKICDVMTDFDKNSEVLPTWRVVTFRLEEILIISAILYTMYRIGRKK